MGDFYKKMAIQQGYVPQKCTLVGIVAMGLVNQGKDPCNGCNESRGICGGRVYDNEGERA